jgi:hypothetical protein
VVPPNIPRHSTRPENDLSGPEADDISGDLGGSGDLGALAPLDGALASLAAPVIRRGTRVSPQA